MVGRGRADHRPGPGRVLVLATPRESGGGAGSDAAAMRAFGPTHPRTVRVLDWVRYSAGHGGWFSGAGRHLSGSGANAFVGLTKRALRYNRR